MTFVHTQPAYTVAPHPQHKRLYRIEAAPEAVAEFVNFFADTALQHLEYVPYSRYILSAKLRELLGDSFPDTIRGILHDRQTGGFTIGVQGGTTNLDDCVKFATAVAHLVGTPNFDAMSGMYYARFSVQHTDNSDSYLRQAYRLFTLHTDGTYVDEATDWLLMMKLDERSAAGGESTLLHLDDWEELERYATHPLAVYKFTYKSPGSKNVGESLNHETFYLRNDKPCIYFIDQFVHPETIEQSVYLRDMSASLEDSPSKCAIRLPVGDLIMLNNTFWMHGRAPFEQNPQLYRELLRIRGQFAKC
ncbi:glutarate dioxygenase GlaH [Paenibacillus koleovorans]|uniref:glutarate dioxygenase GlaH n=1 Tax=Paenibacillus koleovorans TaxID=121608 RepID=UPI000FDC85DD|nr:glutarate dioxygenase GlaH [Paenibacillus koleovorans]